MSGSSSLEGNQAPRAIQTIPSGGVPLSDERLRFLAPQWEATYNSLRRMDELELGEIEPATLFVWRSEQP